MSAAADMVETERRLLLAEHRVQPADAEESLDAMRARYEAALFDPVRKATLLVAKAAPAELLAARKASLEAANFGAQAARVRSTRLASRAASLHADHQQVRLASARFSLSRSDCCLFSARRRCAASSWRCSSNSARRSASWSFTN